MMWIGKISFCLLLRQSITLMSTELRQSGYAHSVTIAIAVTHNKQNIFPNFSLTFQVFQVGGRSAFNVPDYIYLYSSKRFDSITKNHD